MRAQSHRFAAAFLDFAPNRQRWQSELHRFVWLVQVELCASHVAQSHRFAAAIADFAPNRQRLIVEIERLLGCPRSAYALPISFRSSASPFRFPVSRQIGNP